MAKKEEPPHPLSICKPLEDRVVILYDEADNTTPGGIILAGSPTKPQTATVVSVGPGRTKEDGTVIPMKVQPKDRVIVSSYAALSIDNPTQPAAQDRYGILRQEDILAKLPS